MSMKKAFDQTIRDIKREVNKKVLKVPSIEQKVLDATSNEPWGPHGSLLADIAQATRNYHEYQMIMSVMWKRINDTGKNWRHVYKALTVLEYLVAHGSERVIDEIKEHAYQISTLSDFQYIDSGGRDQGNNVRRKSQSLVLLVNDKERILEVRQKAAANREKFRSSSAVGGMHRPTGSGGYGDRYDDDRYGGRDDERNGYGREREWSSRDDDRYGRYGDSYNRDGDRYSRDSDERYGKDGYRDDEYRGRSPQVDDNQYGSRSRSADKDKDRPYDDDDRHSSRGSSVRGDDQPQDGRRIERKFSEQNVGAPPSYEEAVGGSRSPAYSERDGDAPAASAPKSSSPPTSASPSQDAAHPGGSWTPVNPEADTFDAFDPRGSVAAAPVASSNAETDLFGSLSDSFSSNPLAVVPVTSATVTSDHNSSTTAQNNSDPFTGNQSFEDPFGDSPFKAISSSDDTPAQTHNLASASAFQPMTSVEPTQHVAQKVETVGDLEFSDTFPGLTYYTTDIPNGQQSSANPYSTQEPQPNQNDDILAGILPPSEPFPQMASQPAYHAPAGQPAQPNYGNISNYGPQSGPVANYGPQSGPAANYSQQSGPATSYMQQSGPVAAGVSPMASQLPATSSAQLSNSFPQPVSGSAVSSDVTGTPSGQQSNDFLLGYSSQAGESITMSSQPVRSSSTGSLALVTQQPAKEKFEPKSAVWADTLNRGLVNLNISGTKVNPLSDIGIDFEALNRKEKRMEKPSAVPSTSNVAMGKAMGSGSGTGRGGVGGQRAPLNPMAGSGIGMGVGGVGMGGAPNMGMGMGSYGGMNQSMGMGGYGGMNQSMGMGTGGYGGQNQSMGMGPGRYGGMNMGMGPGVPMQSAGGYPPAANMPSGYNPMMGRGGYPPQQPYGGGYQ